MSDEMTQAVLDFVKREYLDEEDNDIDAATPLVTSGIVDSFSMVSLKRFIEKKYSIQIPDADASPEAFDSVDKIVALVRRYQN